MKETTEKSPIPDAKLQYVRNCLVFDGKTKELLPRFQESSTFFISFHSV